MLLCAGALLGDSVAGWLDPMIAMVMSVWLIWAWGGQCYSNVLNLVRSRPSTAAR